MENQIMVMILSFLLLCGIGGSLVYNSKEMIMFQMLLVLIVLIRWKYTKIFLHSVSGLRNSLVKIRYSIYLIFALGGSGFRRVESITLLVMVGRMIPILNSWSGYVVNK